MKLGKGCGLVTYEDLFNIMTELIHFIVIISASGLSKHALWIRQLPYS